MDLDRTTETDEDKIKLLRRKSVQFKLHTPAKLQVYKYQVLQMVEGGEEVGVYIIII